MFNFQDDYIFQRLGYQEEAKKLKNFSPDVMKAKRVALESVSSRAVTEQDLNDFTTYRKFNPYKRGGLLSYILCLAIFTMFDVWLLKASIYTYQSIPSSEILKNPYYILPFAILISQIVLFFKTVSSPRKPKETTPLAVVDAFLVSVLRTDDTTEGTSEIPENIFLDLWVPAEKCSIYHLESQTNFKYTDNQTHTWSDFVYTPVKIFLFQGCDYLIVPPFSARKGRTFFID